MTSVMRRYKKVQYPQGGEEPGTSGDLGEDYWDIVEMDQKIL